MLSKNELNLFSYSSSHLSFLISSSTLWSLLPTALLTLRCRYLLQFPSSKVLIASYTDYFSHMSLSSSNLNSLLGSTIVLVEEKAWILILMQAWSLLSYPGSDSFLQDSIGKSMKQWSIWRKVLFRVAWQVGPVSIQLRVISVPKPVYLDIDSFIYSIFILKSPTMTTLQF